MKLLQIHDYPPFQSGGIELNVASVSRALSRKGYSTILGVGRLEKDVLFEKDNYQDFVTDEGLRVVFLDSPATIKRLISENDVIHIHFTFSCRPASMVALEEAVKSGKPTIVSIRTNYAHIPFSALDDISPLERNEKLSKIVHYFSAENVTLVGLSYSTEATLEKLGIDKPLFVVRNGLADSIIDLPSKDDSIKSVDLTYVGRLCTLKGISYLIDAFRDLKLQFPSLTLRLVGDGPEMKQYSQLVKFFGLEESIFFTGHVKNELIPKYLAATKVVVHPSFTETWCNAVAEALSYGIPVVATGVEGLLELTNHGEFAELVPIASSHEIYKSLHNILSNQDAYEALKKKAERGREFIRKSYTASNQAEEFIKLYENVLYGQTKQIDPILFSASR